MFVALFYVPGHNPSARGDDQLVAAIGALYVIGLSVVGVRLVRGVIIRAGGSREPIVLLGRGPDPLLSAAIRPRRRLAAVVAGVMVPVAAAMLAAGLAAVAGPASNAHAIASLALGVNGVIAAGVLVPAPGFPGWALLLALVDAAGTRPDQRVRRAARVAQSVGLPILIGSGLVAGWFADPMLVFLGLVLGFLIWTGSQAATAQDATERFLAAHVAGAVARPLTDHAQGDEPVGDLIARLRTDFAVVAVEVGGGMLGAIGPRQLAARDVGARNERCSDAMVPLTSLRLVGPGSPAVDLLPEIIRHGFALVRDPDGLAFVEATDLGRQIRLWVALGDRLAEKSAPRGLDLR
ncbi:MAG: hypothetical protein HY264_08375 [Chloroflexi bacterium]|nr:hypothetical protein [Chloroflexota bacterium]